ncbi:hypothetical protein HOC80_02560 [archaeon]|jgi:hypothetical protein|nr:hypothetical protein [archaeon]MBT4416962.1 hypothetical protein [archaeon]
MSLYTGRPKQNAEAYGADLQAGRLDQLKDHFVAYKNGELLDSNPTIEGLHAKLTDEPESLFITKVGDERVIKFRRPRRVIKV